MSEMDIISLRISGHEKDYLVELANPNISPLLHEIFGLGWFRNKNNGASQAPAMH